MSRQFNYTRAASALVESQFQSDATVARSFGVSVRSLETWRSRLVWDETLQNEYQSLATGKLSTWVSAIPGALDAAIAFIVSATEEADPTDPEMIRAMTNAIAVLNEIQIVQAVIEQRKAKL